MRKKKISWCKSIIPCIIGVAASWNPNCHGSAASQGAIGKNSHSRTIIWFILWLLCSLVLRRKTLPIQEDGNCRLVVNQWSGKHGSFGHKNCFLLLFNFVLDEQIASKWSRNFIYDATGPFSPSQSKLSSPSLWIQSSHGFPYVVPHLLLKTHLSSSSLSVARSNCMRGGELKLHCS